MAVPLMQASSSRSPSNRHETSCTLNGVIVGVDGDPSLRVGVQSYRSDEQLRELRKEHRQTHLFRRERGTIVSVSLLAGTDPVGDHEEVRKLKDSASLVAVLALDMLLRYFHGLGRPIWQYKPLRIVSNKGSDQLLHRALPDGVSVPGWLEQRVSYVFDTRVVYPDRAPPTVLLACNVKTCNFISTSCADLLKAGIHLEGRYVQTAGLSDDSRLSAKPRLVGKVIGVQGDKLVLDDHADGYDNVLAADAMLEPRHENMKWCIGELLPEHAGTILSRLDGLASQVNAGPERLRRIVAMFDHLRSQTFELAPGLSFTMGSVLKHSSSSTWFPKQEVISRPPLVFSPLPGRTDSWNERGLDKHGPYDQRSFTPRRPSIAVICQAEVQGQVEQFVRKFLDGMPEISVGHPQNARKPYERGFIRRFALEHVDTTFFTALERSASAYRDACRRAIAHAADKGFEWTLALVQIDDAFHLLAGDQNPYLVTKAAFMKQHVPVQEVTIEKMATLASDLVYIMNDISLATYAKMGGTPWLLSAEAPVAHELVIGVGSHHTAGPRIGARNRVVGITTVFTGDGRYLLSSRTGTVPYAEYPMAILETLERALNEVRQDQNWLPNDSVRLVFHVFKPFKNTEVEAVKKLMARLGITEAAFAFVHVVDDHPFLAFDENNAGVTGPGGSKKGTFAPERGTMLKFTRDEALIAFSGARELKRPSDGLPKPVLLRLHPDSTFKDITYQTRQAFAFSCNSLRGFAPAPLPITVLYSELIATLLNNLESVTGWDAEAMFGRIGRTRWFL